MFPPNEIHFYLANFHPKSQIYKICLSYMCWKSYHYGWQEGRRIWLPPSRTAVKARLMRKCPPRKIFVSNQNCSYRSSCPSPPCSELAAHNRYLKILQFFFVLIFIKCLISIALFQWEFGISNTRCSPKEFHNPRVMFNEQNLEFNIIKFNLRKDISAPF